MTDEPVFAAHLFESVPLFQIHRYDGGSILLDGKNTDGILILTSSFSNSLPVEERALLDKMLKALRLNLENVALCVITEPVPFHFLKKKVAFHQLLVFGIAPQNIGLNINAEIYRVIKLTDTTVIFSESLSTLLVNENSKGLIWKSLKEMFAIS